MVHSSSHPALSLPSMPMFKATGIAILCTILTACASASSQPAVSSLNIPDPPSAVVSTTSQTLTPQEMAQVTDAAPDPAYRLGPNDAIAVSVYLHPDLSVPMEGASGNVGGALITGDGSVELPLIGN